ncbi:MAG: hypothetical protein KatS3mg044_0878 [Rhodothermaceae bacterium]|nr:MAG: hypothetical protein KatS3mg044_0878 [Rhodothermaceae bacterium]
MPSCSTPRVDEGRGTGLDAVASGSYLPAMTSRSTQIAPALPATGAATLRYAFYFYFYRFGSGTGGADATSS